MTFVTCQTCGIAIRWQPTIVDHKTYCCLGCAHGGPCVCDYDNLPRPDQASPIVVRPVREVAKRESGHPRTQHRPGSDGG